MTDATAPVSTAAEANALFRQAQELATAEKVEESFDCYLKAASLGVPPAAYMVSQFYFAGIKVEENASSALVWACYAAESGYGAARKWMNEAYPDGVPDAKQLLEVFVKEADDGSVAGMFMAGTYLEKGLGAGIDTVRAVSYYAAGAAAGSPDCEAAMADCICRGCGTDRDREKGAAILKSISDRGFVRGSLAYANCLEKGVGVPRDRKAAFELYKRTAEVCNLAKYHVGRCYIDGIGTEENREEALTWFQMSQDAGCPYGTFGVARCTLAGVLGGRNAPKGLPLLEEAAGHGCPEAAVMLSQLYAKDGRISKKDPAKASEWMMKAADMALPSAELAAAQMYATGNGVRKDAGKATEYYRRAGLHGNVEALHEAGNAYLTGTGVKKDEAEGFRLLNLASKEGFMKSEYLVAQCYATGKGVPKDRRKALELHTALAEKGYNRSMLFVGECLYNGDGVQRDPDAAVKWFQKGAEAQNVFCMYWMGHAYENGNGVAQDKEKALAWFKKAADKGHVLSQKIINDRQNLESPFEGFLKKAEKGDGQSMYMVGMCYENGVRVEKDVEIARQWYTKAAEAGNEAAKRALEAMDVKKSNPSEEGGEV